MIRKATTSLLTTGLLGAFLFLAATTVSAQTFSNPAPITINDNAPATPYPSDISVTGLTGSVSKVTVTLTGVAHTWPDDVDILLVSPGGQKALVMSDVGGSGDITAVNLTFDDAATATISDAGPITAGTYKPSNIDTTTDVFPAPAPAAPYAETFATFIGSTPNGTWSLYVRDDTGTDFGSIAGGWSITLTTVVGPGTLQFNASTFTGSERSTATVTVTRAGGFDGPVTVNYATSGGTATGGAACGGGVDYVTTSGTLNFAVGELSKTFTVQLCEDAAPDDNETFNVTLTAPTGGATLGTPSTATVTIRDCTQIAYSTTLRFPSQGVTENQIISYCLNNPSNILSDVAVQGLDTTLAEYLQSIDFRPANGQLYGLIVQNNAAAGANGTVRLVTVNPTTGATTAVGTPFTTANPGNFTGFDFNPVADRIRVTRILGAARDANLRINPNDGVFTEDTPLAFAAGDPNAGDDEFIVASAYTNNVAGATSTTLYNIDSSQDLLVRQGSNPANPTPGDPGNPNSGILNTIGPLGVNTSGIVGFDVATDGIAYAVLDTALGTGGFGGAGRLYTINLTTGAATLVGQVGGLPARFTSSFAIAPSATAAPVASRADFDGDGKTDLSVFRDGNWFVDRSTAGFLSVQWGVAGDFIVPEDYNDDGRTDFAVYRPSATPGLADFYVLNSTTNTVAFVEWGLPGDTARPGDFTGDGRADFAVHRASTNTYYVLPGGGGTPVQATFPGSGTGLTPITLDYDGDGKTDLGAWNSSTGTWTIRQSTNGTVINIQWGQAGDLLVPADYDNDNRDDLAVFRNGTWLARRTVNGQFLSIPFGQAGDIPVPGDYDGDGADDQAVFRNGSWFILQSTSGFRSATFGVGSDKPVPAGYLP